MKSTRLRSWTKVLFGLGRVLVPPHVFEVSKEKLRYARFEPQGDRLEARFFRQVELPREIFQSGALGGPLRDHEAFERSLQELLQGLDVDVESASLLLPDDWLRTIRIDEPNDVPTASREEVLRWRLKKLVPFPVEDLRVHRVEVEGTSVASSKTLVGFAVEQLLADLEGHFESCAIRIGQLSNRSFCVASALRPVPDLCSVAVLDDHGYSLVFVVEQKALMVRYKALCPGDLDQDRESLIRRDLRITRGFLDDELPELPLSRSLLCGPPGSERSWIPLLEECLGAPTVKLGEADLRPTALPLTEPWHIMAPMLGAAGMEVA